MTNTPPSFEKLADDLVKQLGEPKTYAVGLRKLPFPTDEEIITQALKSAYAQGFQDGQVFANDMRSPKPNAQLAAERNNND